MNNIPPRPDFAARPNYIYTQRPFYNFEFNSISELITDKTTPQEFDNLVKQIEGYKLTDGDFCGETALYIEPIETIVN